MTQNIYEAADQLQYKNTFKSIQELEMECLQQMQENGIPFQGPLNTNGEIHRFSIDILHNSFPCPCPCPINVVFEPS